MPQQGSVNRSRSNALRRTARAATQRYDAHCDLSTLMPHPQNPNVGAVDVIGQSIADHGFIGVIVAQEATHDDGRHYILAGNHRYRALLDAGANEAPVMFVDLDDVQAMQFMLVDNKAAALGYNDDARLAEVLNALAEQDALLPSGFSDTELEALNERLGTATTFTDLDPTGETASYPVMDLIVRVPRERADAALEAAVKELALAYGGRYMVKGARDNNNATAEATT